MAADPVGVPVAPDEPDEHPRREEDLPPEVWMQVPPEGWERARDSLGAWLGRHPRAVRLLTRVVQVGQVGSLVLLAVALLLIEGLARALVPVVSLLAGLLVLALVARTRTVSLRSLTTLLSVSTLWALGVAVLTTVLGSAVGLSPLDDGALISLAAFIEEPGKLLILLVPALVAPGRVRRLAAIDWALLGYAAGAGFTVAEDFVRRVTTTGVWSALADFFGTGTSYSLNPLTSGSLSTGAQAPYSGEWTEVLVVGHHVSTMLVAATIGLAIAAWRHAGRLRAAVPAGGRVAGPAVGPGAGAGGVPGAGPVAVGAVAGPGGARAPRGPGSAALWWRVAALVGPLAALGLVIVDHAAYNATVTWSGWTHEGELFFALLRFVWFVCGMGGGQVPLVVVLLGLCLVVDAHRRLRAGFMGRLGVDVGVVPELAGLAAPWRVPARAVVALGVFAFSDLAVIVSGYTRPDLARGERMRRGRHVAQLVMGVRRQAMSVTSPGPEPATRRRWALVALATAVVTVVVCLLLGVAIGRGIGHLADVPDDAVFFAGLMDDLASWWESLGFAGQIVVTALAVLTLMTMGASAGLAMGAVGVVTWFAGHGHGVSAFVRDPSGATASYMRNLTLGQLLLDVFDFATTFIPGSALGVGVRSAESALDATFALRHRVDDLEELHNLFQMREEALAASRAARERLKSLLPEGMTTTDFSKDNYLDTLQELDDMEYSADAIKQLRNAAETYHAARPSVNRIAEVAGEVGGVQDLTRRGYEIPESFRPEGLKGRPTGRGKVDVLAVSADRTNIHVPELKGGTSELKPDAVPTTFETPSPQGTAPYLRDHLLTDPRVIEFFRDNPDLWEGVKSGRVSITSEVIATRGSGYIVHSHFIDVNLTSQPAIIAAIEDKIAALGGT